MAFQTGTRVDPRLGALDFSGFTNAATIQAQGVAQLGAAIGGAIQASKQKKKDKALDEAASAMVLSYATSNPDAGGQLGIETLEDAKIAVKTLGGAKPAMSLLMELDDSNDAPTASEITSVARLLERPEFGKIEFDETTGEAFMKVPNKETLRPFDKRRVPVPEAIQSMPGFDEYAEMQRTTSKPQDFEKMGMRVVE
jgi:hypothetical protein|tara:strand:+ start:3257 stop:3847 length:591 start_codon:yes stop_codon:yes gene_type:complete